MNWLNINTSTLDSAAFLSSEPAAQATWLKLQRYCIGQENGGVIRGAKTWTERQWQNLVRVTRKDVLPGSGLWKWAGDDLRVEFYPADQEREVQTKRAAAKSTHAKRREKQRAEQDGEHDADPGPEHNLERHAHQGAQHSRKGKEEKGIEREGNAALSSSAFSPGTEVGVPTLEECIAWGQTAAVPADWIRAKYANTTGKHAWVQNGKVIAWRTLWLAWYQQDRESGRWQKNPAARADDGTNGDVPPPPGNCAVDFDAMRS